MAARSLHRRRARAAPRVPAPHWSAARVSVCALGAALGAHALLLCGFSLRLPAPRTWRAPAALIWVTRLRQPAAVEIAAPLRAALSQPLGAPPTPPLLSPAATILAYAPLPRVPLSARHAPPTIAPAPAGGAAGPAALATRWQLEASGPLADAIVSAWRRQDLLPAALPARVRRPCVLDVRIGVPSFARRVVVLQSSGDPTWDARVVRAVNSLTIVPRGAPIAPGDSHTSAACVTVGVAAEH